MFSLYNKGVIEQILVHVSDWLFDSPFIYAYDMGLMDFKFR